MMSHSLPLTEPTHPSSVTSLRDIFAAPPTSSSIAGTSAPSVEDLPASMAKSGGSFKKLTRHASRSGSGSLRRRWWNHAKATAESLNQQGSQAEIAATETEPNKAAAQRWRFVRGVVRGVVTRKATSTRRKRATAQAQSQTFSNPLHTTNAGQPSSPFTGFSDVAGFGAKNQAAGDEHAELHGLIAMSLKSQATAHETKGSASWSLRKFSGTLGTDGCAAEPFSRPSSVSRTSSISLHDEYLTVGGTSEPNSGSGGTPAESNSPLSSRPTSPNSAGDHLRLATIAAAEEEDAAARATAQHARRAGSTSTLRDVLQRRPSSSSLQESRTPMSLDNISDTSDYDHALEDDSTLTKTTNLFKADNLELQEHREWLHDDINREEAEQRLRKSNAPDGGFLLRAKTGAPEERYAISVVVNKKVRP